MNRDRYVSNEIYFKLNYAQFIDTEFELQVKNQKRLVRVQEMMSSEEEKKKQKQHKAVSRYGSVDFYHFFFRKFIP